ncbi:uncharacterized protein LOC122395987 [Colletes gigas]|uniref:uncharacterized protein LOC122395987 n=1 Tax=Colletes gigas TaxID=935657 RepID=UPI001C9A4A8B|nr:uncharacterized protein LOC122395987 [Colletes gigas]
MSRISTVSIVLLLATIAIAIAHAKPTIYKRNQDNVFEPVMVPVSSTVIPLPVYRGEYSLRPVSKDKDAFNPNDGAKLITIKKGQDKKT